MRNHKEIIQNGSKSFSLASMFFNNDQKYAAWKLYSWCRYTDDLIDNESDIQKVKKNIEYLKYQINGLSDSNFKNSPEFEDLKEIVNKYNIPIKYPLDLIRGMEMDACGIDFKSDDELIDYCYCVAGTVGLMMCHVMGVKDDLALNHAVNLGIAMQLTNISRDITEDLERNRIYIPNEWITSLEVSKETLLLIPNNIKFLDLQKKLLNLADEYYISGNEGLKYLSYQSSLTILIASNIYREIGTVIRSDPYFYLMNRAFVPKWKKIIIIIKSLFQSIPLLFSSTRRDTLKKPEVTWSLINEN